MGERAARLAQFQFRWPVFDTMFLAGILRVLMLVLVAGGLYWLIFEVLGPADEGLGRVASRPDGPVLIRRSAARTAKKPDATVGAEEGGHS